MNWFWDNILLKKEDRAGMFTFLSILFIILLAKWYLVVFYKPQIDNYSDTSFSEMEYAFVESLAKENNSMHGDVEFKALAVATGWVWS